MRKPDWYTNVKLRRLQVDRDPLILRAFDAMMRKLIRWTK